MSEGREITVKVGDTVIVREDESTINGRLLKGEKGKVWKIEDVHDISFQTATWTIGYPGPSRFLYLEWEDEVHQKIRFFHIGYFDVLYTYSVRTIDTPNLSLPIYLRQATCPLCGSQGIPSFNQYLCSNKECKNG